VRVLARASSGIGPRLLSLTPLPLLGPAPLPVK